MPQYLFVYGTLCKGLSRSSALRESCYLGPAFCAGRLCDLGSFPAMVAGHGRVVGEIYRIESDSILKHLDAVEGYDENDPQGSLYLRKKMSAQLLSTGEYLESAAYMFNRSTDRARSVKHGDYRRYLLDRQEGPAYYLAFGSNLNTERLKQRIGGWHESIPGVLPGFRLTYNKCPDRGRGGAYANAVAGLAGRDCPCVAYLIDRPCFEQLDRFEGVPHHYIRTALPMNAAGGGQIMGYAYIAHPLKIVPGRGASPRYREHLLKGYKEHGLGDLKEYETPALI